MSESTTSSKPEHCTACGAPMSVTRVHVYTPLGAWRGVYCSGACADREAPTAKHSKLSEATERFVDQLNDRERAVLAQRFGATVIDPHKALAAARKLLTKPREDALSAVPSDAALDVLTAALDEYDTEYAVFDDVQRHIGAVRDWLACVRESRTMPTPSRWISVAEQLPPRGRRVLVRGASGYTTTPHFFVVAYHDDEYRPLEPWRMFSNEALSDYGFAPTHWREITDEDRP